MPAAPPDWVEPMLATLSDERDLGEDWLLERKLDGVRCLAFVRGGEVVLRSRNGARPVVPGGGRRARAPRRRDRRRRGRRRRRRGRAAGVPGAPAPRRGGPVGLRPALARRRRTCATGPCATAGPPWRTPSARPRRSRSARSCRGPSRAAYERACAAGWEGLIAKRADGRYRGGRSRDWLKLKCVLEQEVVIGGFTEPRRSRVGPRRAARRLPRGRQRCATAGKVGTGFDTATLRALRERLGRLEVDGPPFDEPVKPRPAGTHWVRPELVAQVGFAEWTAAGPAAPAALPRPPRGQAGGRGRARAPDLSRRPALGG